MRKGAGKEAKLVFMAHALMDNRHGLVSDFRLTEANGVAERDAALDMLMRIPVSRRLSVGADSGTTAETSCPSAGSSTSARTLPRRSGGLR